MKSLVPIGVWADGQPAVPEVSVATLARMAKADVEGGTIGPGAGNRHLIDVIRTWLKGKKLGYVGQPGPGWRNPADPNVGWGIVFYKKVPPEVRNELARLREHRHGKVLPDWKAVHTARTWLNDQGITIANRDPGKLPYYLLLVGTPEQISFEDQYQLDRIRAVGRLDFGDDAAAYKTYVDTLLAQESTPTVGKRVVVAAPRNNDEPTRLTAEYLVPAVTEHVKTSPVLAPFAYTVLLLDKAMRGDIQTALCPDAAGRSPALAFVAGHGLRSKDADEQGAWISSEWDQSKGGAVPDSGPPFRCGRGGRVPCAGEHHLLCGLLWRGLPEKERVCRVLQRGCLRSNEETGGERRRQAFRGPVAQAVVIVPAGCGSPGSLPGLRGSRGCFLADRVLRLQGG